MIDRYTRPEMAAMWTMEARFRWWLEVEILSCEAWSRLGVIPPEDVRLIRERARFDVDRVLEIERETRHDVVAFTRAVSESLGPERKWVHYGLTSTDVVDTALAAQLQAVTKVLRQDLEQLMETLANLARAHKYTLMMGRTHGVHAEPTTFGLKVALWYAEMTRNLERLDSASERIRYGKISGAVGTYANVDPAVEQYVCEQLGLKPAPISTQTLQRDRHAEYLFVLALIGTSLDKIATEIRGLQKSEIRELEEPFYKGQKGSSAMPHKRNPVSCEQVSGLARVLRGYVVPALEDVPLWHERDISHSSVERVILPDATILVDYLLHRMNRILTDLHVYPENMRRNMERTYGLPFSQQVLSALIGKGVSREEAYDAVQPCAMRSWEEGRPFLEVVGEHPLVRELLSPEELAACFNPEAHLKHVDTIFTRLGLSSEAQPAR
ncbi:MAG: adenylosuccinate lyase [Alicyclobacillus sp.]|nr:adenylosuccinate lyase [Alicyclobacillus sp.]